MRNYIFEFDNYKFIIETNNCNNILLSEINSDHEHSVIVAIKKFIIFLHKSNIQYVSIYDAKLKDRYSTILKYIYKKGNNTEKWLLNKSHFINDGDILLCKVY
jgi:hypothetical protein